MISQSEPCKQFQIHLKQNKHVNKIKHILAKFMLSTKHNFHGYMHMFLQSSTYNYRTKYICSQLAREQNACVKYVPSPTEWSRRRELLEIINSFGTSFVYGSWVTWLSWTREHMYKCIECNIQHTHTHMQKDIILSKYLPALSKLSYILAVSKSQCVTLYH